MGALLPVLFACAAVAAQMPCYVAGSAPFVFPPDRDTAVITGKPVRHGSVRVSRHTLVLTAGQDFRVDYGRNVLTLLYARTQAETLDVAWEESPFDFKPVYFRRERAGVPEEYDSTAAPAGGPARAPDTAGSSDIVLDGSKTVGISLGAGGHYSVDQSLNLNMAGNISENVRVHAILTDQNMPFEPEGNTESIRELDRVLVTVEGPRARAELGDLFLEKEGSRFGDFKKKIKGGHAEYFSGPFRAGLSGALAEGTFHVFDFPGEEGNQGPYRLQSREGRTGIIVLAGTEKVYIDGVQKRRGQNNDYVIEYGNGQIMFTQTCLITADQRITVEYEYTEMEYPKTLVHSAGAAAFFDGRLELSGSVLRERDDAAHPFRAPMTETDREALSAAGDDETPQGSGIFPLARDSVNIYRGFYLYVPDSAGQAAHYEYHPPGDTAEYRAVPFYRVEFVPVPAPDSGSYDAVTVIDSLDPGLTGTYQQTHVIYVYRGPGPGGFLPGSPLALPGQHVLGTAQYRFRQGGLLDVRGEVTGSSRDKNILSDKDDGNNEAAATAHAATLTFGKHLRDGGPGRFTLGLKQEYVQKDFAPITPLASDFLFWKKWNLNHDFSDTTKPSLNSLEGTLGWEAAPSVMLTGGGGGLRLNDDRSLRGEAGLTLRPGARREVRVSQEVIQAEKADTVKNALRTLTSAQAHVYRVTPRAGFTGEFKEEAGHGALLKKSDYREYRAGVSTDRLGVFQSESDFTFRHDRVGKTHDPGTLLDSARSYTWNNRLNLDGPGDFSADLSVTNRRSRRRDSLSMQRYASDLVSLNTAARPFGGALDHRLRYDLVSAMSQTQLETYEYAREGLGTHERDSLTGDFVPRDGGPYRYAGTRVDTNASARSINQSEVSMRLFVIPRKFAALKDHTGMLRDLSFDSYLQAAQDKYGDAYDARGLNPLLKYVPDLNPAEPDSALCSQYRLNFKQDIVLNPASDRFYVRFRWYPRYRYDFRSSGGGGVDRWQSSLFSLNVRYSPAAPLTFEHEPALEWIKREKAAALVSYDIFNRRVSNRLTWKMNRTFSLPLEADAGLSENREPDFELHVPYFRIRPGLVMSVPEKARAEVSYAYVQVMTDDPALIYEMAEGNRCGTTHRWNLTARYGLNRNIDLSLLYTGEKEEDAPETVHRGSAEMKAYF
jgi:hypothetical protein